MISRGLGSSGCSSQTCVQFVQLSQRQKSETRRSAACLSTETSTHLELSTQIFALVVRLVSIFQFSCARMLWLVFGFDSRHYGSSSLSKPPPSGLSRPHSQQHLTCAAAPTLAQKMTLRITNTQHHLQVAVQPADVALHAAAAHAGHHRQVGEDHAAVEAVLHVL